MSISDASRKWKTTDVGGVDGKILQNLGLYYVNQRRATNGNEVRVLMQKRGKWVCTAGRSTWS